VDSAVFSFAWSCSRVFQRAVHRVLQPEDEIHACQSPEVSTERGCPTRRCSEREPAVQLRNKCSIIGGWLPSLTFSLVLKAMRHPLLSLLAAIAFFFLGGMLMAPFTPAGWRVAVGSNGELVKRPRTSAEAREDNLRVLRVNAPAYICFALSAVSFAWTLFLISSGAVSIIRAKGQQNVDPD